MQDELRVVRRAKEKDEEAFSALYEYYFDKIFRYVVFRIGNKEEAEDVTQQVFVKALHSISSYQERGLPFSSWLFRIAHNQMVDYLRKQKGKPVTDYDMTLIKDSSDPALEVEQSFENERVMQAVQKLTEAQKTVISLRFTSELPIAEVARIMGKSEGAIKALQHEAIVTLRKLLGETIR